MEILSVAFFCFGDIWGDGICKVRRSENSVGEIEWGEGCLCNVYGVWELAEDRRNLGKISLIFVERKMG